MPLSSIWSPILTFTCPVKGFPCFFPPFFSAVDMHPCMPTCSAWGGGPALLGGPYWSLLVCVWAVFVTQLAD